MKKVIYALSLTVFVLGFTGCKKGENDPFLSLQSRKARLAGEWKVSASQETSTDNTGIPSVTNTTYNGSVETTTITSAGVDNSYSSSYTVEYEFKKDGTYSITQSSSNPASTQTITGNWTFLGKSKNAELKKKEAIGLSIAKVTNSSGDNLTYSGSFFPFQTLIIDQLKSKEIIFTYDESSTSGISGSSSTDTRKGSMTLTAK